MVPFKAWTSQRVSEKEYRFWMRDQVLIGGLAFAGVVDVAALLVMTLADSVPMRVAAGLLVVIGTMSLLRTARLIVRPSGMTLTRYLFGVPISHRQFPINDSLALSGSLDAEFTSGLEHESTGIIFGPSHKAADELWQAIQEARSHVLDR